jgi:hypothetical protein
MPISVPITYVMDQKPVPAPVGFPTEVSVETASLTETTTPMIELALSRKITKLGLTPPPGLEFCYYVPSSE